MNSIKNIGKNFIDKLFTRADVIYKNNIRPGGQYNKILVNVFYEPSTRTQLSFECAMNSLGGKVINFNKQTSSINKGESFKDTIKTLSCYGDIMVLRHPQRGIIQEAQQYSNIPIINGGDGDGEHPTQALLDLYTIFKSFGDDMSNVNNLLFIGDCKHSRTIHSLVELLYFYPHICIYFLPYTGCNPDDIIIETITSKQHNSAIILNKQDSIPFNIFDVIYCTRLQNERFINNTSIPNKPDIILNKTILPLLKKSAIIMHPLPRNEEISPEIDNDPRAMYFKQIQNGIKIRMALLDILLSDIHYS